MLVIVGCLIVIGSVLGGFTIAGGHIHALIHPSELLTIGGAALGALIIMSPMKVLKDLIHGILMTLNITDPTNNASLSVTVPHGVALDAAGIDRLAALCGEHLAEGGMVRARLGLESADTDTLNLMNKRMSVSQMGRVLHNLADAGIQTSTLWIVGFPEEDERAFQHSLDFLVEHRDAIYCADPWQFIFHPTVGSEPVFGRLVASQSFETRYGMRRLYPEEFDDALLVQYYELDIPDDVPVAWLSQTTLSVDDAARVSRKRFSAGW